MNQEPYQFKTQNKKKKDKKKYLLLLLLLLLLGLGVILILDHYNVFAENNTDMSETQENTLNNQREIDDSFTEILGHSKLKIDSNNQLIYLENLSANSTYIQYEVLNEDESLYKTKLLYPGESDSFNVFKAMPKGECTLKYLISIYSLDNQNLIHSGIILNQEIEVIGG